VDLINPYKNKGGLDKSSPYKVKGRFDKSNPYKNSYKKRCF
jgi:hypothetical protein